ncbi:hypothetical protein [Mesorhizobium sp. 43Arga]
MATLHGLTPNFRNIRLLLARETGHPGGEREEGYDVLAPLTDEGRLDAELWKSHRALPCPPFRAGEDDLIGRLRRKPGGQWFFDYAEGERDDEVGFQLGDERFVTGEYVSIKRNGAVHTYQVARVEQP